MFSFNFKKIGNFPSKTNCVLWAFQTLNKNFPEENYVL